MSDIKVMEIPREPGKSRVREAFMKAKKHPSAIDRAVMAYEKPTHITEKVAGVTISGAPDDVAAVRAALRAGPLPVFPDELTPDLKEVLGRLCFECLAFANLMRAAGVEIEHRAEAEQAHVLHWLVKLVLKNGDNWRAAGLIDLESWRDAARRLQEGN